MTPTVGRLVLFRDLSTKDGPVDRPGIVLAVREAPDEFGYFRLDLGLFTPVGYGLVTDVPGGSRTPPAVGRWHPLPPVDE